jgi:HTH-type transcriptional regulator / antitoxin HigA
MKTSIVHAGDTELLYPHLGHSLRALLEEKNMSQRELAARAAVSTSYISSILLGNRPISTGFAYKLEQIFSICSEKLMQEQVLRELRILKIDGCHESIMKDLKVLPKLMPIVPILLKKKLNEAKLDTYGLVEPLRRYFKISSFENLPELYKVRDYPEPPSKRANLYLLTAWALHCEELVQQAESEVPFDRAKITAERYKLSEKIRQCHNMHELTGLLQPYGISFLCTLPFEGSIVNGFAGLTANDNLVLIISSREKKDQSIFPALFHMLGHVIHGDVKGSFIDFKTKRTPADKKADRW